MLTFWVKDELALKYAEDSAAQTRFTTALNTLKSRKNALHNAKLQAASINFPERIAELEKEGKTDFVQGGAAELVLSAYGWVDEAMEQIDRDLVNNDDKGFHSKVPSGILALSGAPFTFCLHQKLWPLTLPYSNHYKTLFSRVHSLSIFHLDPILYTRWERNFHFNISTTYKCFRTSDIC